MPRLVTGRCSSSNAMPAHCPSPWVLATAIPSHQSPLVRRFRSRSPVGTLLSGCCSTSSTVQCVDRESNRVNEEKSHCKYHAVPHCSYGILQRSSRQLRSYCIGRNSCANRTGVTTVLYHFHSLLLKVTSIKTIARQSSFPLRS